MDKETSIDFLNINKISERLTLRPTKFEDFKTMLDGLNGQKPAQHKYDDDEIGLGNIYTEDFCKKSADRCRQFGEADKSYLFRVYKNEDGSYIGGVIIKTILRQHYQWGEVGYWLLNQHWGNSYGSEMLKASIEIAFNDLHFHRVEAQINLDNYASQKTAERAGMTLECTRKGLLFEEGKWRDHLIYVSINPND